MIGQFSAHIREFILEKSPTYAATVGKPCLLKPTSKSINEFTQARSHMCALNVGGPSVISLLSIDTVKFTVKIDLLSITKVKRASCRIHK